jgi:hypothetical protein
MPHTRFSYTADVPAGARNRNAERATPRDPRGVGYPCFGYPQMCFCYPDDVRLGTGNRDASLPDLRRVPTSICFRY